MSRLDLLRLMATALLVAGVGGSGGAAWGQEATTVVEDRPAELRFLSERLSIGRADARHWEEIAGSGLAVEDSEQAWDVYRGLDPISAPTFAALVGDHARLAVLAGERKKARHQGNVLVLAGATVAMLALVPVLTLEDPSSILGSRTDDLRALRSLEGRNENRWYAAGAIFGTGLMGMSAAPFLSVAVHRRQGSAANYYAQPEAQDRVDAFDAHLRQTLGLPSTTALRPAAPQAPLPVVPTAPETPAPSPETAP
jgi:hypothetical protein